MYTDGSCDNNRDKIGGYGVVLQYNKSNKQLYGGRRDTTSQRMELLACIKGLSALTKKNINVEIYSDSAYVVNCFKDKWYLGWEKFERWKNAEKQPIANKDLWIELLKLYRSFESTVTFSKVKAHIGIELNELADQLAEKGRQEMKLANLDIKEFDSYINL